MEISQIQRYLIPGFILLYFLWRFYNNQKIKRSLPMYIQQGALIIDVRSSGEFQQARNPISINIPLNEISSKYTELDKEKLILLCCASGVRSGMAAQFLKAKGFKTVKNAGAWTNTLG